MRLFADSWEHLTSDATILSWIRGVHIDFDPDLQQVFVPQQRSFGAKEDAFINDKVEELLQKGVIEHTKHEKGEVISTIFLVEKKDGGFRLILNLKPFNAQMDNIHFKMETLENVIQMMKPGAFMASVDFTDAYFSVPVAEEHRLVLKFVWRDILYQFTCLPMGLCEAPRKFTKLGKVLFSHLRKWGHENAVYLDDSWLQNDTFWLCLQNVLDTVMLSDAVGFTINFKKSQLIPTQQIEFLGCILDSHHMAVYLTPQKMKNIQEACQAFLNLTDCSIRKLAQLLGIFVSCRVVVSHAPIFYKCSEIFKNQMLKLHGGNFESVVRIPQFVREDVSWWQENINCQVRYLIPHTPSLDIFTDASDTGWGAVCEGQKIGGHWTAEERIWFHINYKELLAVLFAVKVFLKNKSNIHVRLFIDNTTAIAYVNNFGGNKPQMNLLARRLWLWLLEKHIIVSAVYIRSSDNVQADNSSRKNYSGPKEWKLHPKVFHEISSLHGPLTHDLMASRSNAQLPQYFSFYPDPFAVAVDCFTVSWKNTNAYVFPPFISSVILRILRKVQQEKIQLTIVLPLWPQQPWFPQVLATIIATPLLLPESDNLLIMPQDKKILRPQKAPQVQKHPFLRRLKLTAFRISGKSCEIKAFHQQLPRISSMPGGILQSPSTVCTSKNGFIFASNNRLIHFCSMKRTYLNSSLNCSTVASALAE